MTKKTLNREIFADFIRTFAIFFVLIVHTTAGFFVDCYGTKTFNIILGISALTSSAVPLFYMLSGCFLIKEKNENIKESLKRSLKIFLQIIFWNTVYILIFKFILNYDLNITKSFIKSFFTEQVTHLWYLYPLLSLYILTPIISKLYNSADEKLKKYTLIIIFIIPIILSTLQVKFWDIINIPKFAIGYPELGLFLLGKYIYDNKEKIQNKKYTILSIIGIILGLILIIIYAHITINSVGISSSKPYFDYNKIPNVLLVISLFTFILSIDKFLIKFPDIIKKCIHTIGQNTAGIYFIHMIYIYIWPNINIFGLHFTANEGNLINMLFGALLYFILSLIITLIIKKIPILGKTIN